MSTSATDLPRSERGHQEEMVAQVEDPLERREDQIQRQKSIQEGIGPFVGQSILSHRGITGGCGQASEQQFCPRVKVAST